MGGYIVDKLLDNLYLLRINDLRTKFFEGIWHIPEGITYNAYVLKTSEGVILFDGWKKNYGDQFLNALKQVVDIKDIKYIVVHHTEPDHSGTVPLLLSHNPDIKILGHPLTKKLLEEFYSIEVKNFRPVKNMEEIEIGGEKLLFIHVPMLHWPDTIFTYLSKHKVLLTCDAFGGYSIPRTIYDDNEREIDEYMFYVKKYLVTVIGFHRRNIVVNIEKLKKLGLDIRVIAPAHGMIWRNKPEYIIEYYNDTAKAVGRRKVTVIYGSMYGSIEKAVMEAVDEAAKQGYMVKVYPFTDYYHSDWSNILTDVIDSDLIIVGGATYDTSIVPTILAFLHVLVNRLPNLGKKVIIISSYGWGGLAGKQMKKILEEKGYNIVDIIEFRGQPSRKDIDRIRSLINSIISSK